ncbi:MAG: hypothetical protein V1894_02730, partial [Chloroflexota bacterium]
DNIITAGTLDLKIGAGGAEADADYTLLTAGISNATPDDVIHSSDYASLKYSGTVTDNYLGVEIDAITNAGGTSTEPEVTAGDAGNAGDLDDFVKVGFWLDAGNNGTWDDGDYYLANDSSGWVARAGGSPATVPLQLVNTFAEEIGTQYNINADLANNETWRFYINWQFPNGTSTDNKCQGDTVDFDILLAVQQGDPS